MRIWGRRKSKIIPWLYKIICYICVIVSEQNLKSNVKGNQEVYYMIYFEDLPLDAEILDALRQLQINYVFQGIFLPDGKTIYARELFPH